MSQSTTANLGGFSIKSKKIDESIIKQSQMINCLFENSEIANCSNPAPAENCPILPSDSTSSIMSISSMIGGNSTRYKTKI